MIRKLLSLAALAAVVLVAGCGGSGSDNTDGFSFVRIINAAPGTSPEVYFREELVDENLTYDDAIPSDGLAPETVDSGSALFEFDESGETTVSRTVNLENNYVYAAIFAGNVGNTGVNAPRIIISSDRTEDLEDGAMNLRFVNAAPIIDTAVDVYVIDPADDFRDENASFINIPRFGVSNLLRLNPGQYRVVITETGTDNVLFNQTRTMDGSTYSTFVAMNSFNNEDVQLREYGADF
jgi:hypothetical protein